MIGIKHTIVIFFGMLGLVIGGVLIDFDHGGTWSCKWGKIWGRGTDCEVVRGFLHKPVFMLSVALLCIGLGIGLLMHYIMDYIPLP